MNAIVAIAALFSVIGAGEKFLPPGDATQSFAKVNLSCGIPPIPPIGCSVGQCVCDSSGRNCEWTFNCN